MTVAINKKVLFTNAWNYAGQSATKLGGKAIEYIASALKAAWEVAKYTAESEDKISKFDKFRFAGLHARNTSKKYLEMNRVSDNEEKIVVCVSDEHVVKTRFGFGLILDASHVVFLKEWQVCEDSWFSNGVEVVLDKNYFNVKEWGDFSDRFSKDVDGKQLEFATWFDAAKAQKQVASWKK